MQIIKSLLFILFIGLLFLIGMQCIREYNLEWNLKTEQLKLMRNLNGER